MQTRAAAAGLALGNTPAYATKPDALAPVHASDRDWPLPLAGRDIDDCAPGCAFHASVRERILADATYQPGNLLRGDRRALLESLRFIAT
jgi:hypothetical protein